VYFEKRDEGGSGGKLGEKAIRATQGGVEDKTNESAIK